MASERKMRSGASLRGLTARAWAQPFLSVPWEAPGLAGLLCWGGWWGWDSGQGETCLLPTLVGLDHRWASGQPRDTAGVPLSPSTAWTNVDDGPGRAGRRTSRPQRCEGTAWHGLGPLIKTLMNPRPREVLTAMRGSHSPWQRGNDPETAASAPRAICRTSGGPDERPGGGGLRGYKAGRPVGSPCPQDRLAFEAVSKQVRPGLCVRLGLGAAPLGLRASGPRFTEQQEDVRFSEHPGGGTLTGGGVRGPDWGCWVRGPDLGRWVGGPG